MFRRYTISIDVNGAVAEHIDGIEKVFGCSVSEPSNWVEYGSTKERGLTFLNGEGHELASPIFQHLPYFTAPGEKVDNEVDEIKRHIIDTLTRYFVLAPLNVKIKVTEYNRL
jgi:hypothetical protein